LYPTFRGRQQICPAGLNSSCINTSFYPFFSRKWVGMSYSFLILQKQRERYFYWHIYERQRSEGLCKQHSANSIEEKNKKRKKKKRKKETNSTKTKCEGKGWRRQSSAPRCPPAERLPRAPRVRSCPGAGCGAGTPPVLRALRAAPAPWRPAGLPGTARRGGADTWLRLGRGREPAAGAM